MQAQATSATTCPECGTRMEGGFSRNLGRCMICLLRVGFDGGEEPDEALLSPVADRLGTYRIERRDDGTLWELGRGAMGVTYRAVDTSLHRPAALKLIDSEWIKRGAEARERFMREARAAAALRHPNVATVYHFGIREENGQCFCAIELVEGETLETRVRRTGPLDALTVIEIALQVSSALAAAEKQGLVHRDLKPANLMILPSDHEPASDSEKVVQASSLLVEDRRNLEGRATMRESPHFTVKVIDFGVAKALAEKPNAMDLTHGFVGTPAFASPEQFTDAPVDTRSDIYSLGATLWYLLTGNRPFQGATIEQIRASQHSRALPLEQLKAAHVPGRLVSLLMSMLAPEPAARPGVRDLTGQLQSIRAHLTNRGIRVRRFALAAALLALGTCAALYLVHPLTNQRFQRNAPVENALEKSIAVLPFENRSEDKENAFFADGMQDDLLTSLVKIKELKVIGRSSVMSYRDVTKRNLREIGQQLGVAHVLEGSVRRAADRVLIYVNLTDSRDGRAEWAEHYDRTIADSTGLQGELAIEIANALRATLAPAEKESLQTKTTEDTTAYMLYLRGREYQMRPEVSRDNYLSAENVYKQALKLDPHFSLARASLAEMQLFSYRNFDPRPAQLAEARNSAEEAVRLDPNCGQAHMALAQIMKEVDESPAAIRGEIAAAVRLLPNDGEVALAAAILQADMGWNDESAASYERAIALNPREGRVFYNYAVFLYWKEDLPRARWASDRAVELSPDSVYFRLFRPKAEAEWTGDVALAKSFMAGLPAGKDPDGRVTAARCTIAIWERNFPEALRLLAACPHERIPFLDMGYGSMVPKGFVEGLVHFYAGHLQDAYATLDSVRWMLEVPARENAILRGGFQGKPSLPKAHYHVALAYAALGWKEAAKTEIARSAVQLDDWNMAVLFAYLGDRDSALPLLERVGLEMGPWFRNMLLLHPQWDSLRADPRFQKLVAESGPKTVHK